MEKKNKKLKAENIPEPKVIEPEIEQPIVKEPTPIPEHEWAKELDKSIPEQEPEKKKGIWNSLFGWLRE